MRGVTPDAPLLACLDFSARATPSPRVPSADACWFGVAGEPPTYHRTRADAWARVGDWVRRVRRRKRIGVVGLDFNLGFPCGFAAAAGFADRGGLVRFLADRIHDDAHTQKNNRFEVAAELNRRCGGIGGTPGPFWGCPPAAAGPHLRTRRGFGWPFQAGVHRLPRLRATDTHTPGVQEVWKLLGVGSVGSQGLLGLAGLGRWLAADRADGGRSSVWPFDTLGRARPGMGEVWFVEAFPAGVDPASGGDRHPIRDAEQVAAWVRVMRGRCPPPGAGWRSRCCRCCPRGCTA